jgi:hypothetical protein
MVYNCTLATIGSRRFPGGRARRRRTACTFPRSRERSGTSVCPSETTLLTRDGERGGSGCPRREDPPGGRRSSSRCSTAGEDGANMIDRGRIPPGGRRSSSPWCMHPLNCTQFSRRSASVNS